MTRGKGKGKYIHKEDRTYTHGELADIDSQINEIDGQIKEAEIPGRTRQVNVPALKKQRDYLDMVRHENAPKAPRSGVKKDEMWNEARQLEKELKDGMPTKEEMAHPATHPGAVHKHLNWDKKNQDKILRYKELMRNLSPQDPTAMDLERLRVQGK